MLTNILNATLMDWFCWRTTLHIQNISLQKFQVCSRVWSRSEKEYYSVILKYHILSVSGAQKIFLKRYHFAVIIIFCYFTQVLY